MASLRIVVTCCLCLLASRGLAQETTVLLEGEVPSGDETHFFLPFEVPSGIAEIEIEHDDLSSTNILDWGLDDPNGFRGWGGGNSEPAVVGVDAASRSYVPGPITPGQWEVVVGKAKVRELPARYSVTVTLRQDATLPAQSERQPYTPPAPLETGGRWYAGDFHVHSRESGDARPPIDEVLDYAAGIGLDFVLLSEHNTNSQLTLYAAAQAAHPDVLLLPGAEFTTYAGHANAIGATEWVDHRIGVRGATIEDAIAAVHAQGALFSINHPLLRIGDQCLGCGWDHDVDPTTIDAVEVQTGLVGGLSYWEFLVGQGARAAAVGGSDDHRAGVDLGLFDSPIGMPTTMVYADELSVAGILQGLRDSRTVVKIDGPQGGMVDTQLDGRRVGNTVFARDTMLRATVTAASGRILRVIKNGEVVEEVTVSGDPFVFDYPVTAPPSGEVRFRHELVDGARQPKTIGSYVWLRFGDPNPTPTVTIAPSATVTVAPSLTPTMTVPIAPSATPTSTLPACAGDCDASGLVSINELIVGVNIVLGAADVSACAALDRDRNGAVAIADLIAAVNASLNDCA